MYKYFNGNIYEIQSTTISLEIVGTSSENYMIYHTIIVCFYFFAVSTEHLLVHSGSEYCASNGNLCKAKNHPLFNRAGLSVPLAWSWAEKDSWRRPVQLMLPKSDDIWKKKLLWKTSVRAYGTRSFRSCLLCDAGRNGVIAAWGMNISEFVMQNIIATLAWALFSYKDGHRS